VAGVGKRFVRACPGTSRRLTVTSGDYLARPRAVGARSAERACVSRTAFVFPRVNRFEHGQTVPRTDRK
jgi:hypothetical protein